MSLWIGTFITTQGLFFLRGNFPQSEIYFNAKIAIAIFLWLVFSQFIFFPYIYFEYNYIIFKVEFLEAV